MRGRIVSAVVVRLRSIQQALSGRPVLMDPSSLASLLMTDDCDLPEPTERSPVQPSGSVAIIQVHGVLMDHPGWIESLCGFIGYQDVLDSVEEACADDNVMAVLLDIASPGGEAGGAFPCMEGIAKCRGMKPLVALSNAYANSGAYAIAAGCDKVYVTPAAQAGSIGSYIAHTDYSRMLEQAGIKVSIIRAGARKADGNPSEPLSEQARAELQSHVDQLRDLFVAKVAEMRGMDPAKLLAQESRIYTGQAAIDAGLADGITTLGALVAELGGIPKEGPMAAGPTTTKPGATQVASVADTIEAMIASYPQASAALRAEAVKTERERISGIRSLAKAGFEAEAEAAIAQGHTPEAFAMTLRKAELANPLRATMEQRRRDADFGALGSTVQVVGGEPAAPDTAPVDFKSRAELAWKASADLQSEFADFKGFLAYAKAFPSILTKTTKRPA